MKILVNAIPLAGLLTGISRYLRNLYSHIQKNENIEVGYFDGKRISSVMPPQAEAGAWIQATDRIWKLPDLAVVGLRSLHWLNYERCLRQILGKGGYDVYHETAFTPAAIKNIIPQVFTLHDLSLMHYRAYHPRERVWFSDLFFKRRIPEASHIIVPSRFIKTEVCGALPLSLSRVSAIPEAPDPFFSPRSETEIQAAKQSLSLPEAYFLFVGTLEPRKNLDLIIEAMRKLPENTNLVLTGWKGWGDKPWMAKAARDNLNKRIFLTGYIDENSLACLYSGALALIYPSRYEGFGLPVLEAMACGCPVICSDAASLPEVAGDAALYVNPRDAGALRRVMEQVALDPDLRADLKRRGLRRAGEFSWKHTAEKTLEVFRDHCQ